MRKLGTSRWVGIVCSLLRLLVRRTTVPDRLISRSLIQCSGCNPYKLLDRRGIDSLSSIRVKREPVLGLACGAVRCPARRKIRVNVNIHNYSWARRAKARYLETEEVLVHLRQSVNDIRHQPLLRHRLQSMHTPLHCLQYPSVGYS